MSESSDTRDLCAALARFNCMVHAVVGSQYSSGWPDRYLHHSRWAGWIEFKTGNRQCTELQKEIIKRLNRSRPGSAYVVRHGVNHIEDCNGTVLAMFSSPHDLLCTLQELTNEEQCSRLSRDADRDSKE